MSDKTGIEWTDATWNPVRGCSLVSDGCKNCYAMGVAGRFGGAGQPYDGLTTKTSQGAKWTGKIMLVPDMLAQPLKWSRPRKIFVNSMSDLFHEGVPDDYIDQVFAIMALAPHHIFQVLTKRPERMRDYVSRAEMEIRDAVKYEPVAESLVWPLPNVWLGVSVEDQKTANERIPLLRQTPAAVRWLSMEPLLGPVHLGSVSRGGTGKEGNIHWVVVGGESGPNARPMHSDWVRSVRDQCNVAQVPFFFKQWGEWAPKHVMPKDTMLPMRKYGWININGGDMEPGHVRVFKDECAHHDLLGRIGKKAAGRTLDGRTWDEYPMVAA